MINQPVAINEKVYVRGVSNRTETVLVYTPDKDSWDELPPPPVMDFTIATLRGRLLVVGGLDKSTKEKMDTILTFDESSQQWVQSLPRMPKALIVPAVVEYQNHLIIIGGRNSNNIRIADVCILNSSIKWITAEPLPRTYDEYSTCLIGYTLYLVGQITKEVFRACVPSLISRASSDLWEAVASVPFRRSSSIAIGNTLLSVGGIDDALFGGNDISSIHMYDPTKDQWTQCGGLPEDMERCHCIEMSGKLYVLGAYDTIRSVYTSIPSVTH